MNLAPITDLLRERIGLDPETLGPTALPRAVQARLEALGLMAPADYAVRLARDPQEFQTLLSDLTVPETWFFRGGELFTYLARQIAETVRIQQLGRQYRILSVPCSTGEEPYSLAIALLEAGVPSRAWVIDGIDLNARYVERARQGRFGDFSFRQTAPEVRRRYFQFLDGSWELVPAVRSVVRFRQGNLLDPFFRAGVEPFDLVFCRNLFIYLHSAARQRALDTLERLLTPCGLLCVGYAEPLELLDSRFQRIGACTHFLYHRTTERQEDKETTRQGDKENTPGVESTRELDVQPGTEFSHNFLSLSPCLPLSLSEAAPSVPVDLLTRARQQADRGQLDEALATCQAYLACSRPSADLFGLMGVLYQARQEKDEAVRCFQRALYLEPGHKGALTHLLLHCQEQGDQVQAARLRRRVERVAPGGEA